MIKLSSPKGPTELELAISGYEESDNPHNNWYMVRVFVSQRGQSFETVFPAIETTELPGLFEWFQTLSQLRLPSMIRHFFTESCLEFEYIRWRDGVVMIGVSLRHEMKPPFSLKAKKGRDDDWWCSFELSPRDFLTINNYLKSIMKSYPVRGRNQDHLDLLQAESVRESLYRKLIEIDPEDLEKFSAECERKAYQKIALKMREDGLEYEAISRYTGLSAREICHLKN